MALLEEAVTFILETAMSLGETLIVTNGVSTWVKDSSSRFLPKLAPVLERIRVHSARAKYEREFPGDPMTWKRQAFKDIFVIERKRGRTSGNSFGGSRSPARRSPGSPVSDVSTESEAPSVVNMVVLGDSFAEIEAAQVTGKLLGKSTRVKTVKFKECPSVNELLGQLRRVAKELEQLVQHEESVHRNLIPRVLPAHLDYLSSWASGWQLSEETTSQWTDSICGA
jgi:hypothetical protein